MSCANTLLLGPASKVDWLKRFRSNQLPLILCPPDCLELRFFFLLG